LSRVDPIRLRMCYAWGSQSLGPRAGGQAVHRMTLAGETESAGGADPAERTGDRDHRNRDQLFASVRGAVGPFCFDEQVAAVFPDMIARSVPGYSDVLGGLARLARRVVQPHSNVYDLGCSLGAATLAVASGVDHDQVEIISVDNSSAMLDRAKLHVASFRHRPSVRLVLSDLLDVEIMNASLVLLNYTMQFVSVDRRNELCQRVFRGLNPGGCWSCRRKFVFPRTKCIDW